MIRRYSTYTTHSGETWLEVNIILGTFVLTSDSCELIQIKILLGVCFATEFEFVLVLSKPK